jgi:hypothetical protein
MDGAIERSITLTIGTLGKLQAGRGKRKGLTDASPVLSEPPAASPSPISPTATDNNHPQI